MAGDQAKLIEFSRNYTQYGRPAAASTGSASASLPPAGVDAGRAKLSLPELVEGNDNFASAAHNEQQPDAELDFGELSRVVEAEGEGGGL